MRLEDLPGFFDRPILTTGPEANTYFFNLPDELQDADAATLAGRYFFLIECKEAAEAKVGRHPEYAVNVAKKEPDAQVRTIINIGLKQVVFELHAIMLALNDREKYPDGAGALVPDFPPGSDSTYADEERRAFEKARFAAYDRFMTEAEKGR